MGRIALGLLCFSLFSLSGLPRLAHPLNAAAPPGTAPPATAPVTQVLKAPQGRFTAPLQDMLTQAYGSARTGANLAETTLNTSNVNVRQFGKLFTRAVDGFLYAQPLIVSGLAMPQLGTHNVVFLATEHNSVYAYDADDPNASSPLWHVNLGTAVPSTDIDSGYSDLTPEIGITSTPVIDGATGTMYVVAKTKDAAGYHQKLHALDITTGGEKQGGPVEIAASVVGTGAGASSGVLRFDPLLQLNRPGLLLANGAIYIAFGSQGDVGNWHGWIMAYDPASLRQLAVFNTTPDGDEGGIWGAGQGLTTDLSGNIYVATGNGRYNAGSGGRNFGDSVVKLSAALNVLDWFTPDDQSRLDVDDMDLGSGGPLLLPGTSLLVVCGKDGMLRLIDTNGMGRFHSSGNNVVQEFQAVGGIFLGRPVYWISPNDGPVIFMWGEGEPLKAFKFSGGQFQVSPASEASVLVPPGKSNSVPLSVSSNGSQADSGIVWASCPDLADSNHQTVHGILRAFDATDLGRELWNSTMDSSRDDVGNYAKFGSPTVVNGKVYEASFSGVLNVYGLLPAPPGTCGATIGASAQDFGTHGGTGRVSVTAASGCTWAATSNVDWITITSGAVSSGSAVIEYSVDVNEGPDRTGTISIAGNQLLVTQNQGCWFKLDRDTQRFGLGGGPGRISLIASDPGCPWTAASSVDWITITSQPSGAGSATVDYFVAPLKKKRRTGMLTIGSTSLTVTQSRN